MSRIGLLSHESQRVNEFSSVLDRTLLFEQVPPGSRVDGIVPGYDRASGRTALAAVIESLARLVDPHNVQKPDGITEPVPGGLIGRIRSEQRQGEFPPATDLLSVSERLRDLDADLRASDVEVLKALSRAARAEATQIDRMLIE
jgi:hypothetical protein